MGDNDPLESLTNMCTLMYKSLTLITINKFNYSKKLRKLLKNFQTNGHHTRSKNCLPFQSTWFYPLVFSGVHVARSLVFNAMFCRSLFVLFLLAIVLSVLLRFTISDYPFGIFKLFFYRNVTDNQEAWKFKGNLVTWQNLCTQCAYLLKYLTLCCCIALRKGSGSNLGNVTSLVPRHRDPNWTTTIPYIW